MKLIITKLKFLSCKILNLLHHLTMIFKCTHIDYAVVTLIQDIDVTFASLDILKTSKFHCYCCWCLGKRLFFSTKISLVELWSYLWIYCSIFYYVYYMEWKTNVYISFWEKYTILFQNWANNLFFNFWKNFLLWFKVKTHISKLQNWAAQTLFKIWTSLWKTFKKQPLILLKANQYIQFLYNITKNILITLTIVLILGLYMVISLKVNFLRHIAAWIIVGNIFFWLMSGFNFFIKKARFGKFTSAIMRFWKHAFVAFWVVEGFLFTLFFYYFLNSSQEPMYFYDRTSLNYDFTLNLYSGFLVLILLSLILFLLQCSLLMITNKKFVQNFFFLIIITLVVVYLFFLESYQIYYAISSFNDLVINYDPETNLWNLDLDSKRLRTKHYYFLMCLIAKYWHFLFIFISWCFFILKIIETKKITYTLLSFNYQNLLILYVLNLLCYCSWIKFIFRRFFDTPYFWFFTDVDIKNLPLFFEETINLVCSLLYFNDTATQFYNLFIIL